MQVFPSAIFIFIFLLAWVPLDMCQLQVYYAFQILGKPSQVLVLFYSGAFLSKLEVRVGTQPHHATSGFLLFFFFSLSVGKGYTK